MSDQRSNQNVGDLIEIAPANSDFQSMLTNSLSEAVEWHYDEEFESYTPEPKQDTLAKIVDLPVTVAKKDIQTKVIKRITAWNNLFDGFERMRVISYIVSPEILLEFFEKGYRSIEVVVGDSLVDKYKEQLSKKAMDVTERLQEKVESGELVVYGSTRPIHTKMYIVENATTIRVIIGSLNMTETAKKAHQVNYCVYFDMDPRDPMVPTFVKDFEEHKEGCTRFMQDLLEQLSKVDEREREKVIEVWLRSEVTDEEVEVRKVFSEIADQAFGFEGYDESIPFITVGLDMKAPASRTLTGMLKNFEPKKLDGALMVEKTRFLDHRKHPIPLMKVDLEKERVVIGIKGQLVNRTRMPDDPTVVNDALQHIEDYVNTIDLGTASDPLITKMNMYEALLYIFSAPFFNEFMKVKRKLVGAIDLRGPRFLYIYGRSHNGKTTFLRFALNMLAGTPILPLSGNELHKNPIYNSSNVGTTFPLIYDDVTASKWRKGSSLEEVCKTYWERRWDQFSTFPQLILTSNEYRMPQWAQTRMKTLDFDVLFPKNVDNQIMLNELISKPNAMFEWFSAYYIKMMKGSERIDEDELSIARDVMKQLYEYAGRPLPEFFPPKPVEEIFDLGKIEWKRLVNVFKKVSIKKVDDTIHLTFGDDISKWEIPKYLGLLPQNIKCDRRGNVVTIQNPEDFNGWLFDGENKVSLTGRMIGFFNRKK